MTYEHEGKTYKRVCLSRNDFSCRGCAFKSDVRFKCNIPIEFNCFEHDLNENETIFYIFILETK